MLRISIASMLSAGCVWVMLGCQGPTIPLSAQQGSSILIPIGDMDTIDLGLIGYGGTEKADAQRGQLKFRLDSSSGTLLTTRMTSIVQSARQAPASRGLAYENAALMVVSLVDIPVGAPLGLHMLYVTRQRGSEPEDLVPYAGSISILPNSVPAGSGSVVGALSSFIGATFTGDPFTPLGGFETMAFPDPMLVVGFDQAVHAVELDVTFPAGYATVTDALEPLKQHYNAAHPAVVSRQMISTTHLTVRGISAGDDYPMDRLAIPFTLKAAAPGPLDPSSVMVSVTLATDRGGVSLLPVATVNWIE